MGLTTIIEGCYIRGNGSGFVTQEKATIMCSRFVRLQIVQGKSCLMYLEYYTPFGNLHVELSEFCLCYLVTFLIFKF